MLSTIEVVATTYGVFMSLAPLLQARKIRQRRSSSDVSILYLVVLVVGIALYLTYGVSIANRFLIITCAVSIVATTTTLLIALAYRSPQPHLQNETTTTLVEGDATTP
jgi:MtN3 and saliva related transmembrane protein